MRKNKKPENKKVGENGKFAELVEFFKIVSDENRLSILLTLNAGEMTVTSIHNKLKLPQNLTSHHISKLKSLELLSEKREGTFRIYSVNTKKLKEYNKLIKEVFKI